MEDAPNEIEELSRKIETSGMPKEVREKALAEERTRVAAIRKMGEGMEAVPGIGSVIQGCLDEGATVAQAQAKVLGHVQANLDKVGHRNARAEDEAESPDVPVLVPAPGKEAVSEDDGLPPEDEELKAEWRALGKEGRAEFLGDFETFRAYTLAKAEGRFDRLAIPKVES